MVWGGPDGHAGGEARAHPPGSRPHCRGGDKLEGWPPGGGGLFSPGLQGALRAHGPRGSPSRSPRRLGRSGSRHRHPGSRLAAPPHTRSGSRTRLGRGGFVGPPLPPRAGVVLQPWAGSHPQPPGPGGGPSECAKGLGCCRLLPQLCGCTSRVFNSPSTTATLAGSMRDTISARSVKEALGQVRTCRGRRRTHPAKATAPHIPAAAPTAQPGPQPQPLCGLLWP